MSSKSGWPTLVGKLGRTPISGLAERALELAPKRSPIAVSLDDHGTVWLDRPDAINPHDLVGVFTHRHDPDLLAEDLRFEARVRGLLK